MQSQVEKPEMRRHALLYIDGVPVRALSVLQDTAVAAGVQDPATVIAAATGRVNLVNTLYRSKTCKQSPILHSDCTLPVAYLCQVLASSVTLCWTCTVLLVSGV